MNNVRDVACLTSYQVSCRSFEERKDLSVESIFNLIVSTTAFYSYFPEKIRLDISRESSSWHTIHVKYQALFSLKKIDDYLLQVCLALSFCMQ